MGNHDPYPVINIHGTLVVRGREFTPTSDNTDLHSYVNSLQYLAAMELQQPVMQLEEIQQQQAAPPGGAATATIIGDTTTPAWSIDQGIIFIFSPNKYFDYLTPLRGTITSMLLFAENSNINTQHNSGGHHIFTSATRGALGPTSTTHRETTHPHL